MEATPVNALGRRTHKYSGVEGVHSMPTLSRVGGDTTVGEKYKHISTKEVLGVFSKYGWEPVGGWEATRRTVTEGRVQKETDTVKHLVRLQNTSFSEQYRNNEVSARLGQLTPTLTIVNSHDGGSSLRVVLGFTRLVCLNGLTVGEDLGSFSVQHRGVKALMSELESQLAIVAERFNRLFSIFEQMSATATTVNIRHRIITAALVIQHGEKVATEIVNNAAAYAVACRELGTPRRVFDASDDLFTFVNRVQENIVKGNKSRPSSVRAVPIRSAIRQDRLTGQLFNVAYSLFIQDAA